MHGTQRKLKGLDLVISRFHDYYRLSIVTQQSMLYTMKFKNTVIYVAIASLLSMICSAVCGEILNWKTLTDEKPFINLYLPNNYVLESSLALHEAHL